MTVDHGRCVTCGDVAIKATVLEVHGHTAAVDAEGRHESVAIELVEPVAPGDVLLCHAGIALEKLEPAA